MSYEQIIYEKTESLALVTLNRPDKLNALTAKLKEELSAVLDRIEQDPEVKVVIVTGAGKAFCVGADVKERAKMALNAPDFYFFQKKTQDLFLKLENFMKPVIAMINGPAIGGGCEVALACDLRVASDKARFGLPEVKIGIMPVGGGTQRLPRLIGQARAKELLYLGDVIEAGQALEWGLVNRIVPADKLLEETRDLAFRVGNNPPLSLRFIKRSINLGAQLDLASATDVETQCASILFDTQDRKEGFQAFLEKRKPDFKGK